MLGIQNQKGHELCSQELSGQSGKTGDMSLKVSSSSNILGVYGLPPDHASEHQRDACGLTSPRLGTPGARAVPPPQLS